MGQAPAWRVWSLTWGRYQWSAGTCCDITEIQNMMDFSHFWKVQRSEWLRDHYLAFSRLNNGVYCCSDLYIDYLATDIIG